MCVALVAGCGEAPNTAESGTLEEIGADALHVVGTSDALSHIVDLAPVTADSIWVLNQSEPFFLVLNAAGTVIQTSGRRGGGPGEFTRVNSLIADPDADRLWAFDPSRSALVPLRSAAEGEAFSLGHDSLPSSRMVSLDNIGTFEGRIWIRPAGDAFFVARANGPVNTVGQIWLADILRVDANASVTPRLSLSSLLADPAALYPGAQALMPFPIWDACPDQTLVLYDPGANALRRFPANGSELPQTPLPAERKLEVTPERLWTTMRLFLAQQGPDGERLDTADFHAMLVRTFAETQSRFARVFPEYASVHCTGPDEVWFERFDVEAGRVGHGRNWLRVGPNGPLQDVRLPDDFEVLRIARGRFWGIHRDEDDVEHVAWVPLVR